MDVVLNSRMKVTVKIRRQDDSSDDDEEELTYPLAVCILPLLLRYSQTFVLLLFT